MKFLTNQERRLRSNWIPAMGKATYLWLRLYGPGGYLLSQIGSWSGGVVLRNFWSIDGWEATGSTN